MDYCSKLKTLRENKKLTQEELANIIKISRVQYNQYENDYNTIPLKHLNNLSNYFKVSIDYLLDFNVEKNYQNNKEEINKYTSGERLKTFRKENKITQAKLAEKLNVSRTTITEYERGVNLISTTNLYDICNTYHISADYLLGKIDSPKNI